MRKLNVLVYDSISKDFVELLKQSFDVTVFKLAEDVLPEDLHLILFKGEQKGHINPDKYGEVTGKFTNLAEKYWNKYETLLDYTYRGIPCLGIEDGAHFLTTAAGGSIIQCVQGHDKDHYISDNLGLSLITPSNHTQMMYPYDLPKSKYKVLAWSTHFVSPTYLNGKNEERELDKTFLEPEFVYYSNKRGQNLCIQGDPSGASKQYGSYCLKMITKLLDSKL